MFHRVFVIWTHPLFHDTIRLLLEHPGIELVGTGSVYSEAFSKIEELQPDTVIVEETEANKEERVSEVLHILETSPWCSRILRISLEDNDLWVYHREQRTINSKEDLLQVISG